MIIRRYIQFEALENLFRIIGLLLLIYASNKFVIILSDVAIGKIPRDLFLTLLAYKIISVLPTFLPFTLLLAVVLTYSRLINDKEMVVLLSSGVSGLQLLKIVFRFSVYVCSIAVVVVFYIAPWAEAKIIDINNQAKQESEINGIVSGQFKEFNDGNGSVYIESISNDSKSMNGIFMHNIKNGKSGILTSDNAHFKTDEKLGNRYLVFQDGKRYIGEAGELGYQITNFKSYAVLIEANTDSITKKNNPDAFPTSELLFSNIAPYKAELQWRFSSVVACMLLGLLAVLISNFSLGHKRLLLIFISILSYIVYSNLLSIAKSLLERGKISSLPGLWSVHIMLIIIMLIIYYYPVIKQWKHNVLTSYS